MLIHFHQQNNKPTFKFRKKISHESNKGIDRMFEDGIVDFRSQSYNQNNDGIFFSSIFQIILNPTFLAK